MSVNIGQRARNEHAISISLCVNKNTGHNIQLKLLEAYPMCLIIDYECTQMTMQSIPSYTILLNAW